MPTALAMSGFGVKQKTSARGEYFAFWHETDMPHRSLRARY
jgi:hypothetical protein